MKPLLKRIQKGEIDPSFVVTHRMRLEDAPAAYALFMNKQDECMKVMLTP
jgi:threonine dehydrogenase-like Zn-dependent dehydrogenase